MTGIGSANSHPRFALPPTCAGRTRLQSLNTGRLPVHPRACGADPYPYFASFGLCGSSPRVRGLVPFVALACSLVGGSSLRVQGLGVQPQHPGAVRGFIPAGTGSGLVSCPPWSGPPVHPCGYRVWQPMDCGPNADIGFIPACAGFGKGVRVRKSDGRFIPACAGSGGVLARANMACGVHPCLCQGLGPLLGSSTPHRGFIPACAGSGFGTGSNRGAGHIPSVGVFDADVLMCAGQFCGESVWSLSCGSPVGVLLWVGSWVWGQRVSCWGRRAASSLTWWTGTGARTRDSSSRWTTAHRRSSRLLMMLVTGCWGDIRAVRGWTRPGMGVSSGWRVSSMSWKYRRTCPTRMPPCGWVVGTRWWGGAVCCWAGW